MYIYKNYVFLFCFAHFVANKINLASLFQKEYVLQLMIYKKPKVGLHSSWRTS